MGALSCKSENVFQGTGTVREEIYETWEIGPPADDIFRVLPVRCGYLDSRCRIVVAG